MSEVYILDLVGYLMKTKLNVEKGFYCTVEMKLKNLRDRVVAGSSRFVVKKMSMIMT